MKLADIREREQAANSIEGKRQFPITEVDEQGQVLPCNVCGNPAPGMSHRCTEFLFNDIKYLLDALEEAIGLLEKLQPHITPLRLVVKVQAFLTTHG